ncbi:MAG: flagellar biosynthesis protein FlhF, partial [Pseudomonadota bacterium]
VEQQFDALSWDELQRREPRLAEVIRRLELLGIDDALVRSIVARLDPADPQKKVWRNAIALLARQIPIAEQDVCADGGVFAVVGPTGAGKTTSIAKLAARFALDRGADAVGLVTTDSFRIGAQEHLLRFGRILGVPVQVAGDAGALAATLEQLAHKKLVLIDTAGCSPRDGKLLEALAGLTRLTPTVQTLLTLPANLQTASIREAIGAFDRLGLDGAIVTKVDEATSLGGILSELIAAELAACYVTDGQRVPEDIRPAARYRAGFVSQAVSLARSFAHSRPGHSLPELPEPTESAASEELPPLTTTERRLASYG